MTNAEDMKELIAENTSLPSERRALESTAARVEDALSRDVPYRPQFKAELRAQLMAQARRKITPWYARPSVWGSALGVAAAAAVFAIGLQMLRTDTPPTTNPPVAVAPTPKVGEPPTAQTELVAQHSRLPVVNLADEELVPDTAPSATAADQSEQKVFTVQVRVDADTVNRLAAALGFQGQAREAGSVFTATLGSKSLQVAMDGHVIYEDQVTEQGTGTQALTEDGARAAAQTFLTRAAVLPVEGAPAVTLRGTDFVVTFTPQVEGRPIINGRTTVVLSSRGQIMKADAYVKSTYTLDKSYKAISPSQAVTEAQKQGGGTFTQADLVYVRTPHQEKTFLQPYWRVFGTSAAGKPLARYVPALIPGS